MKRLLIFSSFLLLLAPLIVATVTAQNLTIVPSHSLDGPMPDLTIESITVVPASPNTTEPSIITVRVRNIGTADAPGIRLYLYINPEEQPPTSTTVTIPLLYGIPVGAGESVNLEYAAFTFTKLGCDNVIYAWVDPLERIDESDETNNLDEIQVCVETEPTVTSTPVSSPTPTNISTPTSTFTATPTNMPPSTVTPTPVNTSIPTPTPTPLPADDYEPNNTCEDASPIPPDGTIQEHTFHAENDQDWLSFEASEGMTYTIQVRVPAGSLADVIMEVYGDCDTVVDGGQDPSFSPDVRFTFTAPTAGSYHLRLLNHDPNQYGADVRYNVSVRALDSVVNPGALVVVAGQLFSDPIRDLQSNIRHVTNNVYNLFRAKNYPAERIYYLATELDIDATGDGQTDVDALSSKASLEYAITEWTADKGLGEDRAFTLYLMDHGGENGIFYLDEPRGERVTAQELDGWLDELEVDNPGVKVNIIIEACFSGGFLNRLSRHSGWQERNELLSVLGGANRIIITSTDGVSLAYASPNGAWFSDSLLDALAQDMNLADAFDDARNSAREANPAQEPFIDGNGNGTPNEEADYQAAAARGFAIPGSFADERWVPYIKEVAINNAKNSQAELWAEVDDDQSLAGVWAVVYTPSYQPPESQGELVSSPLPENLHDRGNDEYAVLSSSFSEEGTYHIVFYAQDNQDLQARPVTIEFTIGNDSYQLYLPAVRR